MTPPSPVYAQADPKKSSHMADQNTAQESQSSYKVSFDGFSKNFPKVRPSSGAPVEIVYVNFRDDHELVIAAAHAIAKKIPLGTELIVILGDQANGLGVLVATQAKLPWIIIKNKEGIEGVSKKIAYSSITSGSKKMFLSPLQLEAIKGKKVVIMDDVISTGSTVKAAASLIGDSVQKILGFMCVFTEEVQHTEINGIPVTSLGHLPVFPLKRA